MRKQIFQLLGLLVLPAALLLSSCQGKYKYETVPNDPMKTRIYTLPNGLKVYLSVNKETPRLQTIIAVNAGGKNDPAETTGLAHYFEHLMFKGTESFGSVDYETEKIYLDKIEELFETYRNTTDEAERTAIYAAIDSVSQIAARYAIPNEYDKLMSAIGSQGTNAFTSNDITAYVEDIPANQIENWAKIQSDRFINPVIRLFHTELETVYEEYNMGKASDIRQVWEKIFTMLFPHHPYGTQTVIGTPEQLKNPSIVNIKKFFDAYYVPNNMAVIMVGDLDPDKTIAIIDRYFGKMERKDVPEFTYEEEPEMPRNIADTVIGQDPACVAFAYRLPSPRNPDVYVAELVSNILTNGKTGLFDVNLVQQQQVMYAQGFYENLADYGMLVAYGMPRQGQSLTEVKDLMEEQIEKLKRGEFSEEMLSAIVDNYTVDQYKSIRNNRNRAMTMMAAFNTHEEWADVVNNIEKLSKVTKQDVVDFANKYLNHYAVVYKLEGAPDYPRIEKPQITPLSINRDTASQYLKDIQSSQVKDIEPLFPDYKRDMTVGKYQDRIELLYKHNDEDPLFTLYYVYEMGKFNDKTLDIAFEYLPYLGTDKYSPEELQNEFYKLAADYHAVAADERVFVTLSGIDKNFEASLALFEHLLASVQADPVRYANLANDLLKIREDAKKTQRDNYRRLLTYAIYGPENPLTYQLSNREIASMDPNTLTDKIKSLKNYEHTVMYFGPQSMNDLEKVLSAHHTLPEQFLPLPVAKKFEVKEADGSVYFVHYDAPQVNIGTYMKGADYNVDLRAPIEMYNNYFGGGMSGIVFQEMREARALAYTAYCYYTVPSKPENPSVFQSFIGSQTDKMKDAVAAFNDIIQDMPVSEKNFTLAKNSTLDSYRTDRFLRSDIFFSYLAAKKFGLDEDPAQYTYEHLQNITLNDVIAFQQQQVKGKPFDYTVLGNKSAIDMNYLKTLGKVKLLTTEDIFGY
ncbi:MAG: insulinase family protein [Bacteroidales bacterium]|nr:insulinase family protein [Bacteroidales bacterium]